MKKAFHYDMEEVSEPVTVKQAEDTKNQKHLSEKQIQALRASTQTTPRATGQQTQTIENQTRAIQQSRNVLNKSLQKSNKEGIQEYDEIRKGQVLTNLVCSNTVDSSIVKTVSKLLNDENKGQFSLEPEEGNQNLFTNNPHNPQKVLIKG